MEDFSDLLYPGSPFLPKISDKNTLAILQSLETNKRPLSVTVAFELVNLGLDINQYHLLDLGWLINQYVTDKESIDLFLFGFTMAPSLLIGAHITSVAGAKEAIKRICAPATDDFLLKLNRYKSTHLFSCFLIYQSLSDKQKEAGLKILDYSQRNTFSVNRFYLAGIESCKLSYLEFFRLLETNL